MEKYFTDLQVLSIGLLFDTEKKMSRGNLRIAEIVKPGKLLQHFALNKNGSPYDFIIVIDHRP